MGIPIAKGAAMPRHKTTKEEPIGKRIKKIRLGKKISLDRMANETGLAIDQIKEIEAGKTIPPVGVLLQIARALQVDSGFLFKEQETAMKKRVRAFTKRTDNYAYTTLTPGAENKHLKAFRISIDAMQEHKGVGYQHEGEEFVYVLQGKVEVMVGDHVNRLKKDDSLHFNSAIQHKIRNIGKEDAEMLVVVYGP
jgi:transcriptional regulator with XRE-family HTH domain